MFTDLVDKVKFFNEKYLIERRLLFLLSQV
jgi:hypothetical protein